MVEYTFRKPRKTDELLHTAVGLQIIAKDKTTEIKLTIENGKEKSSQIIPWIIAENIHKYDAIDMRTIVQRLSNITEGSSELLQMIPILDVFSTKFRNQLQRVVVYYTNLS